MRDSCFIFDIGQFAELGNSGFQSSFDSPQPRFPNIFRRARNTLQETLAVWIAGNPGANKSFGVSNKLRNEMQIVDSFKKPDNLSELRVCANLLQVRLCAS